MNPRSLTLAMRSTSPVPAPRRRRVVVVAWTLASLLGSLVAVGLAAGPARAEQTAGITEIDKISLPKSFHFEGGADNVIVDASARRVIVFCPVCLFDDFDAIAFDADTHRKVGTAQLKSATLGYAVDEVHHRWFQATGPDNALGIEVVDTRTLSIGKTYAVQGRADGSSAMGIAYSAKDDVLYVATKAPFPATDIIVTALGASSGTTLWMADLAGCDMNGGFIANGFPWPLGASKDGKYLYTVCVIHDAPGGTPPGTGAVARLTLPSNAAAAQALPFYAGAVDFYPGLIMGLDGTTNAIWVPKSERMVAVVKAGDGGFGAYVFDTATEQYVAAPTLFSVGRTNRQYVVPGIGSDPVSGRVYVHSLAYAAPPGDVCKRKVGGSNAFAIAEAGIAQNATYLLPSGDDSVYDAKADQAFDPQEHNLWMVYDVYTPKDQCDAVNPGDGGAGLIVFHDSLPEAHDRTASDVDAATKDVDEVDGQTGANAGAQASAFGVKYALAPTGFEGVLTNVGSPAILTCDVPDYYVLPQLYASFQKDSPPVPPQYQAFCKSSNREATFANVPATTIDASEVRATAIAGDTNSDSARDLENGTDFSRPGPYIDSNAGYLGGPGVCQHPDPDPKKAYDSCSLEYEIGKLCGKNADSTPTPSPSGSPSPSDQVCGYRDAYLSGDAFPYVPSSCSDTGATPDMPVDNTYSPGRIEKLPFKPAANMPGYSIVGCSLASRIARGRAVVTGASTSIGLPVFAQDARADTLVQRTQSTGSVATATSVVDGINVGDLLHIGRLTVAATAHAHGRPKTNAADYTCTVSDVSITVPNNPDADIPQSPDSSGLLPLPTPTPGSGGGSSTIQLPGTNRCDDPALQADIAQLNHALTGLLSIEFPTAYTAANSPSGAQAVSVLASPRGYLAQVQTSQLRYNANLVLIGDKSIEQPGMVVTMYGDTAARHSRLVTTFGGVAAAATYGIFNLADEGFDNNDNLPPSILGPAPEIGGLPLPPLDNNGGGGGGGGSDNGGGGIIGAATRVGQAVVDGIRFLAEHPGAIPPLVAVWALLASPGYLASRRRTLLGATGGTA